MLESLLGARSLDNVGDPCGFSLLRKFPQATILAFCFPVPAFTVATSLPGTYRTSLPCFSNDFQLFLSYGANRLMSSQNGVERFK